MIDPRRTAVLIRGRADARYVDKTAQTHRWERTPGATIVELTAGDGTKAYCYPDPDRVLILENPTRLPLPPGSIAEVRGEPWSNAKELVRFDDPAGDWTRVFYTTQRGESSRIYRSDEVRIVEDASTRPRVAEVLRYWRDLVDHLPSLHGDPHPLVRAHAAMGRLDPDSVLARYLSAEPIPEEPDVRHPIFPFSSNLSQRDALLQSLRYPISVIDGPPGTGKTQTILNLLATLTATPGVSVAVVSANNAAVDNVREKLGRQGLGFIVASLGNRDRKDGFFAGQASRNAEVERFLAAGTDAGDAEAPPADQLRRLQGDLLALQHEERDLARLRQEQDALRLEFRHFSRYLTGHEVADLDGLPLLRRSPDRILDYLADTQLAGGDLRAWPLGWVRRLRWLVKYGPLAGVDAEDSGVVLGLQRAYYERRIAELAQQIARLEDRLSRGDLAGMAARQQELSLRFLHAGLRERYGALGRGEYDDRALTRDSTAFCADYPVVVSTCHSLRGSIAPARLLDYLIVDEASQVDLLAAAPALASARRVIVVGDLAQLPHIPEARAVRDAGASPFPAYDYGEHSLLSSLQELYGDALPRTMLREHYRCDPAIIGFCNEKFYDRRLVPFTSTVPGRRPLVLHTTVEGNHMRAHSEGGLSNQREIDVIEREVIPQHCADVAREDIGVTSPYRKQITKLDGILVADLGAIEADTVHRFQGREKRVVVMSTVLDETWRGRRGTRFVDDPHLVNVAVSRAEEMFVLVTDHDMLPTTRHLRDLMEYIRYHDPEQQPHRSSVVSVFDLLYRRYSERLLSLSRRLRGEMRYASEDIIWTVLRDLLAEEDYRDLDVRPQVLVQNLIPDLTGLTAEQAVYVRNRCSVDFVVYRRVTRRPLLAIEVDGFAFHENRPDRRAKDALKRDILERHDLPLLSLPTTGGGEPALLRAALDDALSRRP